MCLLDEVISWDEQTIICESHSHRLTDNPLRSGDHLPVEAGIEYAAQAMAIHGSLLARASQSEQQESARPRIGYLAVLSKVEWSVMRLDDVPGGLEVRASCIAASAAGSQYQFTLSAAGRELLSGQALVALSDK